MHFEKSPVVSGRPHNLWMGIGKDYLVFTVMLLFLINVISKWSRVARKLPVLGRWPVFLGLCGLTIFCAALALYLDFLFIRDLEIGKQGLDLLAWQRVDLTEAIYVRDLLILVPAILLTVAFGFVRLIQWRGRKQAVGTLPLGRERLPL
jgi:hypothetical protein